MKLEAPELFMDSRPEIVEAEQAAMDCLRFCLESRRLTDLPLPIPAETWVENPLDFDFAFEPIASTHPHLVTNGFAQLGRRLIRINVAIEHDDASVRWTTAHEIGHELLHARYIEPGSQRPESVSRSYPGFRYADPMERQADRFAAAFLMPQVPLVQAMFRIAAEHGLNTPDALQTLTGDTLRATELWSSCFIPGLARTFGVREPGVFYRLADLRLFDGAAILLPKHLHRLGILPSM